MAKRATWLCKWCFRRNSVESYRCPICLHVYGTHPDYKAGEKI